MIGRRIWRIGPAAVNAGRDITGTVLTGPLIVQAIVGGGDSVRHAIFDPASLYQQHDLARFTGRADVIAAVDAQLTRRDRGYVVISGAAGVGKSTLAAHLVWTRPYAFHFTGLVGGRSPTAARRSLAAQIIGAFGLAAEFTPGDVLPPASVRPEWLLKVIQAAARRIRPQPLVLVIDGLDQASPDEPGMDTGVPLGLPPPDALPSGVFVVATTRSGTPLPALRDPVRTRWTKISIDGADNVADMRRFLTAAVAGPDRDPELAWLLSRHAITTDAFVDVLVERCRGVWIYLKCLLDDMCNGACDPHTLGDLPDRLRGYYLMQIGRWAGDPAEWQRLGRPLLCVLGALLRRATATELAAILRTDDASIDESDVITWLHGPYRAFLDVTRDPSGRTHHQIRHESLRDLLRAAPSDDADADADGDGDGAVIEELRIAWTRANRAVAQWLTPPGEGGTRDWPGVDDYIRLQLPAHAADGEVLDPLLTDPGFLLTCSTETILRYRGQVRTAAGIAAVRALEAVAGDGPSFVDPVEARWRLHVWAARTGAANLHRSLLDAGLDRSWHIGSAFWSGTTCRVFAAHDREVLAVAPFVDPDGRARLVTGGSDGMIRTWDPDFGVAVTTIAGRHDGPVWCLAVLSGPLGASGIVSGGADGRLRRWDPHDGSPVGQFQAAHQGRVLSLAVLTHPGEAPWIASGGDDGLIRIHDAASGTALATLSIAGQGRVWSVAALHRPVNRSFVVAGTGDGFVRVWDATAGVQVGQSLKAGSGNALSVTVLQPPGGPTRIVSGSDDGTLRAWDAEQGRLVGPRCQAHGAAIWTLAALPGPGSRFRVISGGPDWTVRLWDVDGAVADGVDLTGHRGRVWSVCVLPGGRGRPRVVSGADNGMVRIWDAAVDDVSLPARPTAVWSVAAVPGPHRSALVAAAEGRRVWIRDPADASAPGLVLSGHTGEVNSVAVVPGPNGSHRVVTGSNDGTIRLWDGRTGTAVDRPMTGHRGWVTAVQAFRRPGRAAGIASAGFDGTVRCWDPDSGAMSVISAVDGGDVAALAVLELPDGRVGIAAAGPGDGGVSVWAPDTGARLARIPIRRVGEVVSLAVLRPAPNVVWLACGDRNGTVRLWDVGADALVATLRGHRDEVTSLAALPSTGGGLRLVSGGADGTVRLWDAAVGGADGETLIAHDGEVWSVAPFPQAHGATGVLSGGADRTVFLWSPAVRTGRAS